MNEANFYSSAIQGARFLVQSGEIVGAIELLKEFPIQEFPPYYQGHAALVRGLAYESGGLYCAATRAFSEAIEFFQNKDIPSELAGPC